MNKFLKQYPQLYTPKTGDRIKIVQFYNTKNMLPSYMYMGRIGILEDEYDDLWIANMQLTNQEYATDCTWTGRCTIGYYNSHFIIL